MAEELTWMFSMLTGELHQANLDKIDNDEMIAQVALKEKPKGNCKKCYGRLYTGYNSTHNFYIPCIRCVRKYAFVPDERQDDQKTD